MRKLILFVVLLALLVVGLLAMPQPAKADTCTTTALTPADSAFGLTLLQSGCPVSVISYDVTYNPPVGDPLPVADKLTLGVRWSPYIFEVR